jgi:hypothetical protein
MTEGDGSEGDVREGFEGKGGDGDIFGSSVGETIIISPTSPEISGDVGIGVSQLVKTSVSMNDKERNRLIIPAPRILFVIYQP